MSNDGNASQLVSDKTMAEIPSYVLSGERGETLLVDTGRDIFETTIVHVITSTQLLNDDTLSSMRYNNRQR